MDKPSPLGNVISVRHNLDGTTHVALDNGPTKLMNIAMYVYQFPDFSAEDSKVIHGLLAYPQPGARNKVKRNNRKV